MQFSAQQISELLGGDIEGNPEVKVSNFAKIEEAQEGDLSFLANPRYESFIYETNASIVIVNNDFVATHVTKPSLTLIRVKNAYAAFSQLLQIYNQFRLEKTGREEPCFIHESATFASDGYIGAFAYVGKDCKIGNNVKIYPHVYIGDNVTIGDNVVLYSGVKVYHDCVLGSNIIIHSNTVIGSDGFGFAPQEDGSYSKVPQIGNVVINDNVEIGANTVVDRATMGSTLIKEGVKLDNLIQIAHNVEVGKNSVIAAQTGVSGSAKIGENVVLGGQVGVVGHITIADRTQVQAQTGINKSIKEENKKWGGSPVLPYQVYLRSNVVFGKLSEVQKRLDTLEKQINEDK